MNDARKKTWRIIATVDTTIRARELFKKLPIDNRVTHLIRSKPTISVQAFTKFCAYLVRRFDYPIRSVRRQRQIDECTFQEDVLNFVIELVV